MQKGVVRNGVPVRPLPLWGSLVLFAVPTLLMWLATRYGIPALRGRLAGPDVLCWFVAGGSVFACLFAGAFVAFWIDKGQVSLNGLAKRFRFRTIRRSDVLWSLGVFLACGLFSGVIVGIWSVGSQVLGILPNPELSPPFVEMELLAGKTLWVLLAWLPLFFFNITGEELWWRGYILPRQEQAHGKAAWIVHGVGLALFHLPLGIHITVVVSPFLFGIPFVVQKRRNLWTGFIVHGILNGGGFLAVAFGLAG